MSGVTPWFPATETGNLGEKNHVFSSGHLKFEVPLGSLPVLYFQLPLGYLYLVYLS